MISEWRGHRDIQEPRHLDECLGHRSQMLSGVLLGAVDGYAAVLERDAVGSDDRVECGHMFRGSVEVLEGEPHQRVGVVGDGPSVAFLLENQVELVPVREGVSCVDQVAVSAPRFQGDERVHALLHAFEYAVDFKECQGRLFLVNELHRY